MRIADMRELRSRSAELFGGEEPFVVTRHGRVSGIYLPLHEPDRLPTDLRRELAAILGRHLAHLLATEGVTAKQVVKGLRARRKRRR